MIFTNYLQSTNYLNRREEQMLNGQTQSHSIAKNVFKTRMPTSMAAKTAHSELVRVTPEQAKRWLSQNTDSNRKPSMRTIEAYAVEMKAGRWTLTHQGIAFNQSGELIDGQHRLHAIIMSGMTIEMMVTTGLALEYNSPVDQGYNRSYAHLLGKNTRWVSVVRSLVVLEGGMPTHSFKTTVGLLETTAARHAAAIDAILSIAKSARSSPTGAVALLAFAYPIDINKVSNFARQLDTGELLEKGDPALALRRWVAQGRHSPRETIIATASALRHAMNGKQLHRVASGSGPERDGSTHYIWFVQRRRALKIIEGTPSVDLVTNKRLNETDEA